MGDTRIPHRDLETGDGHPDHHVKIDTVQRAKGLDFTAVHMPTLWTPTNTAEPEERALLRRRQQFVAQTRARDRLWVGTVHHRHDNPPWP